MQVVGEDFYIPIIYQSRLLTFQEYHIMPTSHARYITESSYVLTLICRLIRTMDSWDYLNTRTQCPLDIVGMETYPTRQHVSSHLQSNEDVIWPIRSVKPYAMQSRMTLKYEWDFKSLYEWRSVEQLACWYLLMPRTKIRSGLIWHYMSIWFNDYFLLQSSTVQLFPGLCSSIREWILYNEYSIFQLRLLKECAQKFSFHGYVWNVTLHLSFVNYNAMFKIN